MRSRLLVLLAGAAICLGAVLVAVPSTATADTPPPDGEDWTLCSSPSDTYCIESVTANGSATTPASNGVIRDFPWFDIAVDHVLTFGVYHDVNGTGNNLTYGVDQSIVYVMTVRTGSFVPREMHAIAKNGDYLISGSAASGWKATLQFQPTAVHHAGIGPGGCSVNGSCVSDTTPASWDVNGMAVGSIEDLEVSGLSSREIAQRTGMFSVTNAQNENLFYDFDTASLLVQLANPHLTSSSTPVTDGTYDAFIPDAYLIGVMNVPDPAALTSGSFVVTKTVGGSTTSPPFAIVHEPGGIRIKLAGISFSKPTYKFKPKPRVPGKPRLTGVKKLTGAAKSSFLAPLANGGRAIDAYQAACHAAGKSWHYKIASKSPITISSLPPGTVYCQVRAHNSVGWGPYGKSAASKS